MRRKTKWVLAIIAAPLFIVLIVTGVFIFKQIQFDYLPVLDIYSPVKDDGLGNWVPTSVGQRIGRTPLNDVVYAIPGQPDRHFVYVRRSPLYWYGYGWLEHDKSALPNPRSLRLDKIAVFDDYETKLIAATDNPEILQDVATTWSNLHPEKLPIGKNTTYYRLRLISSNVPGVAYDVTIAVINNADVYVMLNRQGLPANVTPLRPLTKRWILSTTAHS